MKLALKYMIFALIATAANIAMQEITLELCPKSSGLLISVMAGTLVGLLVKYVLDKHYIFGFSASSALHDSRTFLFYSLMGIVTTAVFWGFEFIFHLFFGTKQMRYLGASLGLALGYVTKYHLDKRFVFGMERA